MPWRGNTYTLADFMEVTAQGRGRWLSGSHTHHCNHNGCLEGQASNSTETYHSHVWFSQRGQGDFWSRPEDEEGREEPSRQRDQLVQRPWDRRDHAIRVNEIRPEGLNFRIRDGLGEKRWHWRGLWALNLTPDWKAVRRSLQYFQRAVGS